MVEVKGPGWEEAVMEKGREAVAMEEGRGAAVKGGG